MPGAVLGFLSGLPSSLSRLLHPEEAILAATTVYICDLSDLRQSHLGKQEGYHKDEKHFEQFASRIIKCTEPMHECIVPPSIKYYNVFLDNHVTH